MGDHAVVDVDNLVKPKSTESTKTDENLESRSSVPFSSESNAGNDREEDNMVADEEEPLIQIVECRICQEEDQIKNLEIPCACSGSLKVSFHLFRSIISHFEWFLYL
ncbi:hypothetical protein Cni_G11400 [Canna indica]|uniref:RING-CH-type domain-containing protein n=1 Tax=Canna indica TaxID=4628 RepID=A0AAQ3KBR7_9LILI|nr:hypothetical protein Cni_G11400 [Canna indica]